MSRKATVFLLPVRQVGRSVIRDKYLAAWMRVDGTYARWLTVLYDSCCTRGVRKRRVFPDAFSSTSHSSGRAVPHYLSCRRYLIDGAGIKYVLGSCAVC